ncbi:hypothetical protein I4U23_029419 [Adineta vaga]|nr:hypothetical protein I4U23_029419 [Adineta vaga]
MWSLICLLILFLDYQKVETLSCYQCSMKYSNTECNSNNSIYVTECQPTYDTCLTIVLKPSILDEIIITKYCTKRKACELQQKYTHSLTPCEPNNEGRNWACVSCCGERDLCNHDDSNRLIPNRYLSAIFLLIIIVHFVFFK